MSRRVKKQYASNVEVIDFPSSGTKQKKPRPRISPRSKNQKIFLDHLKDEDKNIIFAVGVAGSGKTLLAVTHGIKLLQEGSIDRIIITRPAVSVDEDLGFLPGTLNEKMTPWTLPIFDIFSEYYTKKEIDNMLDNGVIEIAPLSYMRGRAEPLSANIPTPSGYKKMGDLKIGDVIFGSNGDETTVTGVFPQGEIKTVDVHFSDSSVVRCSSSHLWNTRTANENASNIGFTTKTTLDIQKSLNVGVTHEVPIVSEPVKFNIQPTMNIDPYLIGCYFIERVNFFEYNNSTLPDYEKLRLISKKYNVPVDITEAEFNSLNIGDTIPDCYLYNDFNTRLELLSGLMDNACSIYPHEFGGNSILFHSIDKKLPEYVKWLVESVGGVASEIKQYIPVTVNGVESFYNTIDIILPGSINPFKNSRLKYMFNPIELSRFITDIVDVEEKEECQCISVSAKDQLYLTNNFIVTHNTFKNAYIVVDEAQLTTQRQMLMVLTRIGDNCKMILTGDLAQADRTEDNGLRHFLRLFENKQSDRISVIYFNNEDIHRHPVISEVLEYYKY